MPAAIVLILVFPVLWLISFYVVEVGTCSGDGGSPYSADASPAGKWCDGGNWFRLAWNAWIFVAPVAFISACIAMAKVRTRRWVLIVAGTFVVAFVGLISPGWLRDTCTSEQRAAGEDCEIY